MKTAMKGESDKAVGSKQLYRLLPERQEEIPPVRMLQRLGQNNLKELMRLLPTTQTNYSCQEYLERIRRAFESAGDLPLIPDLRPNNWVKVGEKIVVHPISVGSGQPERRMATVIGEVTNVIIMEGTDLRPSTTELEIYIDPPEDKFAQELIKDFEHPQYDLLSPYIMKMKEHNFFQLNPATLDTWIDFCGSIYGMTVSRQLAQALQQELSRIA